MKETLKEIRVNFTLCPSCKRIRDDEGYWQQIESYISSHSTAQFSHSLCSDCLKKHYPDFDTGGDER